MARKINMSQLRSELRRIENKRRQAINQYNQQVRQYNNSLRQSINKYNAAVNRYNSAVRQHNSNVIRNRQIIQNEIRRLRSSSTITSHQQYNSTLMLMHNSYSEINNYYDDNEIDITPEQEHILDLIDKEQVNSLQTSSTVMGEQSSEENIGDCEIVNKLETISPDLSLRWKGAIYSLNSQNPDAARHFCTSARELFTEFIELKASDTDVFAYNPHAAKTDNGNATRKEKIRYMMRNLNMTPSISDFADADIDNILSLFHVLSDATHGSAGRYDFDVLLQVKKRVEQGINFLIEIAS